MEDMVAHAGGTLDFAEVEAVSAIRTSGAHPQNAMQHLKNKLAVPKLAAATYKFDCVVKSPACRFVLEARQQEVLLPHEVFHILYHEFPEEFDKRLRGHPGILESFWANQAGNPLLEQSNLREQLDWNTKTIPLGLHGDGRPVSGLGKAWGKQLDLYSMFSLLAHGSTKDVMILLHAGFCDLLVKESMKTAYGAF